MVVVIPAVRILLTIWFALSVKKLASIRMANWAIRSWSVFHVDVEIFFCLDTFQQKVIRLLSYYAEHHAQHKLKRKKTNGTHLSGHQLYTIEHFYHGL